MWILQARSSMFVIKRCVFVFTFHQKHIFVQKESLSKHFNPSSYVLYRVFFTASESQQTKKIFQPNFSRFFNGFDSCIKFFDSQINFLQKNCSAHICSKLRSQTSPAWLEKTKNVFHKCVSTFEFSFASSSGLGFSILSKHVAIVVP